MISNLLVNLDINTNTTDISNNTDAIWILG